MLLVAALLAVAAAAAEGGEHGGSGEHGKQPPPAGPAFVKIPPIVVPVIEGDKVTRQVGVNLVLELVAGRSAEDIAPKQQRLHDAFISDLYGIYQAQAGSDRPVSEQVVKARFARSAARVLGPGFVKDVLIQQMFEQRRSR
jgi:flagellar basal body-associated protein FliL